MPRGIPGSGAPKIAVGLTLSQQLDVMMKQMEGMREKIQKTEVASQALEAFNSIMNSATPITRPIMRRKKRKNKITLKKAAIAR